LLPLLLGAHLLRPAERSGTGRVRLHLLPIEELVLPQALIALERLELEPLVGSEVARAKAPDRLLELERERIGLLLVLAQGAGCEVVGAGSRRERRDAQPDQNLPVHPETRSTANRATIRGTTSM